MILFEGAGVSAHGEHLSVISVLFSEKCVTLQALQLLRILNLMNLQNPYSSDQSLSSEQLPTSKTKVFRILVLPTDVR